MKNQKLNRQLNRLYKSNGFFFWLILFTAVFIRCFMFGKVPGGINADEVSIGYDAWALLNYGVDRNLSEFPVHLIAWGSGQNALYAYLSMPFIYLFGLNMVTVRLTNLIFGIISVFMVYFLVKKLFDKNTALTAMFLTAISPWHIMLSRWGLESNLFPALYLIAVTLFVYGMDNPRLLLLSSAVFALSLYSYGTAYFTVPVTCLVLFVYLIRKKSVSAKYLTLGIAIFTVIAFPILIFLMINKLHLIENSVDLGFFTVPKMTTEARVDTAINHGLSLHTVKIALQNMYRFLIVQDDGLLLNIIKGFGIVYLISLPFTAIGLFVTAKKKNLSALIIFTWFMCGLSLFFMYCDPNINRTNIIYLPVILFTAVGVNFCADKLKGRFKNVIILCYLICFTVFSVYYFTGYNNLLVSRKGQKAGIDKAIACAEQISEKGEKIYYSESLSNAYIYVLFCNKISPYEYAETAELGGESSGMQIVSSFADYRFNVKNIEPGLPGIYVMFADEVPKNYKDSIVKTFNNLVVLEIK